MSRAPRAVRTALVIATAAALAGAAPAAHAQRSTPRSGVLVDPDAHRPAPTRPHTPGSHDPRMVGHRQMPRYPVGSNTGNPVVVYVMPGYGYPAPVAGYPVGGYGSSVGSLSGAYDTNGRPLSAGFDAGPTYDAVPSYTPDLSGLPFVAIEGGAMMVDLPNGERRTFPSCAGNSASVDPSGRPRTVFYSGAGDGVMLRQGQRGRVQGSAVPGACYSVDALGRLTLS
jgi:hypothetical protein